MAGTFLPPGLTTSDVKITSGGTDNYVMTAVDGETIQGEANLTFDGSDLTLADDVGIIFGDAGEKIEGDGTNLVVASSGNLVLNGAGIYLKNAANDENMLGAVEDGAVTLYHNNVAKLATSAGGVSVTGILYLNDNSINNVGNSGSDWDSTSLRNAGDYFGINGKGMVIGHTAKIATGGVTAEFQVVGNSVPGAPPTPIPPTPPSTYRIVALSPIRTSAPVGAEIVTLPAATLDNHAEPLSCNSKFLTVALPTSYTFIMNVVSPPS